MGCSNDDINLLNEVQQRYCVAAACDVARDFSALESGVRDPSNLS